LFYGCESQQEGCRNEVDPARKIAADDWQTLEQALVHAPSSFDPQPASSVVQ
jgi:hypothetical protein